MEQAHVTQREAERMIGTLFIAGKLGHSRCQGLSTVNRKGLDVDVRPVWTRSLFFILQVLLLEFGIFARPNAVVFVWVSL